MFKCQLNLLPSPLNLFTVNNTQHNHFTRHNADLHVNTGLRENVYRFSVFIVYTFGTIFQNKFPLMYHMLVMKKLSEKRYKK